MPRKTPVIRTGGEFFIAKQYAHTHVDSPYSDGGVRIFRQSTETVCLQIRTFGPLTEGRNGKHRAAYSSVGLNIGDIDAVCRELQALKAQLVYEPGNE